jgi:hypothetical protein
MESKQARGHLGGERAQVSELHYFLFEYDRRTGDLEVSEFTDEPEATAALHVKETAREQHVEVVLLLARSLDDLKITHSRFFKNLKELEEDLLAGFAARRASAS